MNVQTNDDFTQNIRFVHQRAQALYQEASEFPWRQPKMVVACLEELQQALEELRVAEEELQQQNEELLLSQQAIKMEQQRYKELFDFAPDGYLITDLHGTMQEANQAAGRLFDRAPKALIGKPLAVFVPESYRPSFRTTLNQLPMLHRVQEWDLKLQDSQAAPFDATLTVEAIQDQAGNVVGLRWLVRDTTARKQAEAQMQRMQLQNLELIEADRLKNQFLATISHELRTPLSSILGFAHLLLRRLTMLQDWHLVNMVQRVIDNGRHLLLLIEEILDFSSLKANKLALTTESVDVIDLVRRTLDDLRPLTDHKNLHLELLSHPLELSVETDPKRLRQILTNLISNAIKFTDKGRVSVEIWDLPEGKIAIMVRDTGIGIAPADHPHIFKEFWQVNQSITRQKGGTGLGLAIVQTLVQAMGGVVSVDSQLGRGATFRVELPRRMSLQAAPPESSPLEDTEAS